MIAMIAAAFVAALTLSACSPAEVPSVDRENLFTLSIGRMEDQIDLFGLESYARTGKTRLAMRDGIFYVSDGNGAKITRFTSYGDLLSMIYDPDANPPPLTLETEFKETDVVTRRAVAYPLNSPGELAVDSRKQLYVEDRLPPERRSYDAGNRSLLDSVVLHFDGEGRFLEYLGQEGIGGTPFPLITGLHVSVDDELAVVCRLSTGWNVYWFDRSGNLLFLVKLASDELPVPPGRAAKPSLDRIVPACDGRTLYIKIDYYRDTIDESTDTRAGIGYDGSVVWSMNAETGAYGDRLDVQALERVETENDQKVAAHAIYSLTGASRGGKVFLSAPADGGYDILLLQEGSRDQKRGFIRVDDEELMFNAFFLSEDGILSALLASEFEAKTVWWRTDRFVGEPRT